MTRLDRNSQRDARRCLHVLGMLATLALVACGDGDADGPTDAGVDADAGTDGGTDAGSDGGTDAGTDTDGGTQEDCPEPQLIADGRLEPDTTLANVALPMACVDYVVTASALDVSGNLTLAPGVVMTFAGGVLRVGADATLVAEGTEALPIVLTDAPDRAEGWAGLRLEGAGSLDRVTIANGGTTDQTSSNYRAPASITVRDGGALSMRDSTIRDGAGYGIFVDLHSSLPLFEGNTVTGNAEGAARVDATAAHGFRASNSYTGNGVEGIFVNPSYGTVAGDVTWDAIDVPWVITREVSVYKLRVLGGDALTLAAGATLEFESEVALSVTGSLSAVGTADAPIVLTARAPETGPWGGLILRDDATALLEHVVVSHAGAIDQTSSNYVAPANVTVHDTAAVQVRNSTVRDSRGWGIFADQTVTLPVFEGNTITANALGPVRTDAPTAHFFKASSSYTGNGVEGIFVNPSYGTVAGDVTWDAIDVPWVITREVSVYKLRVLGGDALTLAAGATLEFESEVAISVAGSLSAVGTANAPIVLAARAPETEPWGGLILRDGATALLEHVVVSNAGAVDQTTSNYVAPANVTVRDTAAVQMRNSTVRDSRGWGLFAEHTVTLPTFQGNTITANALGSVRTDVPTAHFFKAGNSYGGNGTDGVYVNPTYGGIAGSVTWDAIGVPWVITREVGDYSLRVPVDQSLTLAPGAVVHLEPVIKLVVAGTLTSEGTEDERVEIRNVPLAANFAGILVDDGLARFAYASIINGGGAELGYDDLLANVVVTSFTNSDDVAGSVFFGPGMEHSGAPFGLAFDNWRGSDGTTVGGGPGCGTMVPFYHPYPGDTAGQCG